MDLGSILNSDSRSTSRASGLWVNTSSYTKAPSRTPVRPRTGAQEAYRARLERPPASNEASYGNNLASVRTTPNMYAPSKSHRGVSQRTESIHLDAHALQSLSLGPDQRSALHSRLASIQPIDQRDKYHRSVYGTPGVQSQRSGGYSHAMPGVGTSQSIHQTGAWRATHSVHGSQPYWPEDYRAASTHPVPERRAAHLTTTHATPSHEQDHLDNISVTSDEACSDSEDERRQTPDTPNSEHTHDAVMPSRCQFQEDCKLLSPDRKVTSHYFGRNKKETRAIPPHCWVLYCRQHYQRCRYRAEDSIFASIQMDLVRRTVQNLEKWGGVKDFNIALRKKTMEMLNAEDRENQENLAAKKAGLAAPHKPKDIKDVIKERWLIRFCGPNQSFKAVYEVIDAVDRYCKFEHIKGLEFELVPKYYEAIGAKKQTTARRAPAKKNISAKRVSKPARPAKTISPRLVTRSKT